MRLLLISNSTTPGQPYLGWPKEHIREFLASAASATGKPVRRVAFVPYAAVTFSYDEYEARVQRALDGLGLEIRGVHREADPVAAVRAADAVMVGGGNTFALLARMQEQGLVEAVREAVLGGDSAGGGVPYVGWSAGSNVACPTIRTTNDMPIVEPESFAAAGLVPFQINPHYLDAHPDGHAGETREQRIEEFLAANPGVRVAGLREGCLLKVESATGAEAGISLTLVGQRPMRIFRSGDAPREVEPGGDLSFLLG